MLKISIIISTLIDEPDYRYDSRKERKGSGIMTMDNFLAVLTFILNYSHTFFLSTQNFLSSIPVSAQGYMQAPKIPDNIFWKAITFFF